jgi:diguanylate cyclase (GGDEF)-like protein
MLQSIRSIIPVRYRLITFFVATSLIGVILIFVAVYNASSDLEIISDIQNTHRLLNFSSQTYTAKGEFEKKFAPEEDYQFIIFDKQNSIVYPVDRNHLLFSAGFNKLEDSRRNEVGGYLEIEDKGFTWSSVGLEKTGETLLLFHSFKRLELGNLVDIYINRLFVPGIFYVWLMLWVALILRFLTDKLIVQNEELEKMALHDSLTGLPNRVRLLEILQKEIQDSKRSHRTFALAVFDLNKFKEVNDTYGHDNGDELLRIVAKRINNIQRPMDMVARLGGDEFVLIFSDVDKDASLTLSKRIQSSVLGSYVLGNLRVNIGLSIGIAMFPEHGNDQKTLMKNADLAMYEIKAKGGGIKMYDGVD